MRLADGADGKQVVVKSYEGEDLHSNPAAVQHMRNELAIAGKLQHPNIIAPRSVVRRGDRVDVEMEYAPGGTLADVIKKAKYSKAGRLEESEARKVFSQLVEAVAYLHATGIVHGDIKPGNVLFDSEGTARLIDFGAASEASEVTDAVAVGTLAYMPPEALRPEPRDSRAGDVWSLGVLLFNLLDRGDHPFPAKDEAALRQAICTAELRLPAGAGASCTDLLRRMLNKGPRQRIRISDVQSHAWLHHGAARRG